MESSLRELVSDAAGLDMGLFRSVPKIIYGFGVAGRWSYDNFTNVIAVVDTDKKKWGINLSSSLTVKSPESLRDIDFSSAVVIVSSVDIFDVLPLLHNLGVRRCYSLGAFIDIGDVGLNKTGESDEFLRYTLSVVKECHKNYLDSSTFALRSIDLIVTEKCTLKCVDCANLMQFYESPVNIPMESSISDVEALLARCDSINEVRVIGGEPFLNKEIHSLVPRLVGYDRIRHIVIYTNGMIPIKEELLPSYIHSKIVFSITDYGDLGRNTKSFVEQLAKYGIAYRLHPPEYWTDSGKINDFKRTLPEMVELFAKCCGKNLYSVAEGKLYRCPFVANADRLGAIPPDERNFVRLGSSTDELRRYSYEIDYIPACNYCNGRSFDAASITPAVQTKRSVNYIKFTQTASGTRRQDANPTGFKLPL